MATDWEPADRLGALAGPGQAPATVTARLAGGSEPAILRPSLLRPANIALVLAIALGASLVSGLGLAVARRVRPARVRRPASSAKPPGD